MGTTYTAETLRRLTAMPGQRFVWLIGADNLQQLAEWRHWERIFRLAPIAVFDRSPYSRAAVSSKAGHRFADARVDETTAHTLKDKVKPAWTYIHLPPHPASSTAIRAQNAGPQPRENGP
jgi:nicotinate-nucleotide adenylyltransferase